jgi:hypothetical protein
MLIPETTDDTGIVQKLSEVLLLQTHVKYSHIYYESVPYADSSFQENALSFWNINMSSAKIVLFILMRGLPEKREDSYRF